MTLTVIISIDAEGEDPKLADMLAQYFTRDDCDLNEAYGPEAFNRSGYDGPYITRVKARAITGGGGHCAIETGVWGKREETNEH